MKAQGVLIAERIIKGLFNSPFDEMFDDLNIREYEDKELSFEEFLKKYFWRKKGEDINQRDLLKCKLLKNSILQAL